jgi:DNA-binding transcriptional regulator YiaG
VEFSSTASLRAIEIAEKHLGTEELATRMNVTATTVRAWRMGHAGMPPEKFAKLVGILASLESGGQDKTPGDHSPY